jgi:DMSO reductase family type II enzyme chaperone
MGRQARIRSQLYAALAQGFRRPEAASEQSEEDDENSLIQVLRRTAIAFDAQALGLIAEKVIQSLEIPESQAEQALCTLEIEYNRLFVGPGRPQAPPYESVYRSPQRLVMGPAARDVERLYAEAGLALAPDHHDLPDHVATELGFMAYLALRETEAQGEEVLAWLNTQHAFLRDHLTVWLPRFCQQVREMSQHPFYAALAELTVAFVSLDAQRGQLDK